MSPKNAMDKRGLKHSGSIHSVVDMLPPHPFFCCTQRRITNKDHRGEILKFQQEERLLLKAWKNMSSALQQQTLDGDLRPSGPVQSFLSRQRQSSRRRRLLQPR
ncbi:protein Hook homolog isoform X1 [Entelurus aequoreus]|uniref:protein Hook homolog isoform X1 n=1 Tax=Entelurus aequoreus TaxID=161455 RepID=UPI002B1E4365|nr:protein Hook homolog isoform X1 [Entelurus aequoreus]